MGKARSNAPASAIINGLCKFRVACRKGNHRRSWRARNCTSFAMPPSDQDETKAARPGAGVRIALSRGPSPDGAMLSIEHWLEMGRRNSRDTRLRKQGGRIHRRASHFGRTLGSPPGLPGGGMTGVLPVSGVGARISGSTPDGGHSTPSDFASLSPSGSFDRPTVESDGLGPACPVCAQLEGDCGGGGAVCCGGVAGVGGACANVATQVASNIKIGKTGRLICMQTQPPPRASVPSKARSSDPLAVSANATRARIRGVDRFRPSE